MVSWNWLDAIPQGDARCRTTNADDTTTIAYKAVTDKLARAKPIPEWDAAIAVEGEFGEWLDKTLGVEDRKDANARLVSAVLGDKSSKLKNEIRLRSALRGRSAGCFFRRELDGWRHPTCRMRRPNREPAP